MASQLPEKRLNVQKLLIALLKIISSGWVPSTQFERLAKDFGVPDGKPLIFFLTGLMQIIREVPLKVFESDSARSALLDSLQEALDAAIEREEMRSEQDHTGGSTGE